MMRTDINHRHVAPQESFDESSLHGFEFAEEKFLIQEVFLGQPPHDHTPHGSRKGIGILGKMRRARFASVMYLLRMGLARNRRMWLFALAVSKETRFDLRRESTQPSRGGVMQKR